MHEVSKIEQLHGSISGDHCHGVAGDENAQLFTCCEPSRLSWMIQRLWENIDAIINLSELKPISAELLLDKQVSKTPGILNCTLKVYTQLYTYIFCWWFKFSKYGFRFLFNLYTMCWCHSTCTGGNITHVQMRGCNVTHGGAL